MPPLKIVNYPHPALRHPAVPVTLIDREIRTLADAMTEAMHERHGAGLAAPQVAVPYQLFLMRPDPEDDERVEVVINPVILEKSGQTEEAEEGCLSFPKLYRKVRRPKQVKVKGIDLEGKEFERSLSDLPARIFQHEFDHLHGKLFIDYFGVVAKLASRQDLAAFEQDFKREQERKSIPSNKELMRQLRRLEEQLEERTREQNAASAPLL